MENQVRITSIEMEPATLQKLKCRFEAIKAACPEQFIDAQPLKVSRSELYMDRVEKIMKSALLHHGAEHPPAHENINQTLYANLQTVNLIRVLNQKPQQKKVPLPILAHRDAILQMLENNQVVLIRGATGCGKTTQVPQFILDSFIGEKRGTACRIACTQPRRVAAISIADRVAKERQEKLGGASVGFLIRAENEMPRPEGASILFCTVGVLLRKLHSDPFYKEFTHIIVDEIHERAADSDLFLAILKMILPLRPDLRVIVMSATLEVDQFSAYFDKCPTLEIPGKSHVVEEVYLDQIMRQINMPLRKRDMGNRNIWSQFITNLIVDIHEKRPPGAILVFCSGYADIERLYKNLKRTKDVTMKVYVLHSLVPVRRDKIFAKPSDEGTRKIILSTNVAESSITIEDVVYVVDNGRSNVMSYNTKKSVYALENLMITKANAAQRKGRAGRCHDGIVFRVYHRESFDGMEEYVRASITRERLDSVLLQLKVWNFGPEKDFLATLISPPPDANIDDSLKALEAMQAIDEEGLLTTLGRKLANLHLEPQLGMMLIYAAMFGCVDPITSVVAFLSFKDVFMLPLGHKKGRGELKKMAESVNPTDELLSGLMEAQLELDGDLCSDHMTRVKAVLEYQLNKDTNPKYCQENYLNEATMKQVMAMRATIVKSMVRNGLIEKDSKMQLGEKDHQRNRYNVNLLRSVICGGLCPNVVELCWTPVKDKDGKEVLEKKLFSAAAREMHFHEKSINSIRKSFDTSHFVFFKAVSTHKVFLHDSTMVHSLALALFAPKVQFSDELFVIDGFLSFRFPVELQLLIQSLRLAMKNIFNRAINNGGRCSQNTTVETETLNLITDVLAMAEVD